jgi:fructan beta-fructosidase
MWMSDPNGMVYYDGEYHLFYQHNPIDNVWGPMHWGHAVSKDLVHWEHLPIALYPDSLGTIFSGSAVIDWNNTSGLGSAGSPPMIAIFTHHNHELEDKGSNLFQYQSIAYSLDKGRSWEKYEDNPVLKNPGIRDFRDPKVIWYPENQVWIMVLAAWDRILIYSSPDLLTWKMESEFLADKSPDEGVWECPDLFPLKVEEKEKWVLVVSVGRGGPNGGSGTRYFVGDFDGHRFTALSGADKVLWLDWGKDNYAGVTWSDVPAEDGRRIFLGWMSNWEYANLVPTEKWRSAMTLPRELKLISRRNGYLLASSPVEELVALRGDPIHLDPVPISDSLHLKGLEGIPPSQYEISLELELPVDSGSASPAEMGLVFGNDVGQSLKISLHPDEERLEIDRSTSGKNRFSEEFGGIHVAPFELTGSNYIKLHLFLDRSSIELFVNDGGLVMTELFFPHEDFSQITLYASGGEFNLRQGTIYPLIRTW